MNILDDIVRTKRDEITSRKRRFPAGMLREGEHGQEEHRSLSAALQPQARFRIIAEVKRVSPSAGVLRQDLDPAAVARSYELNGAAGVSVLTDERFFGGSLQDLRAVRSAVGLPILRKDFILDEYQLLEAKAFGADAVLLIAALLAKSQLADLFAAAVEYGLECLVELYETKEIDILDFGSMHLIGVNNRDLRTLQIDLTRTVRIAAHLPSGCTIVSESGITAAADLRRLSDAGIRAALIGEHFMNSVEPGRALGSLLAEADNEPPR